MKCPAFAIVVACLPAAAQASVLTPSGVFLDADPLVKLVMLTLVGVTLAAAVVGSRKLVSAEQLTGGSAFLRSMRLIGPLIGLAGAGYVGLSFFIALSNAPQTPSLQVMAPGIAEIMMLVVLGLLSGVVAGLFNWAVEARIDRAVLRP